MPYRWTTTGPPEAAAAHLMLWPHQSLGPQGFVTFFAVTASLLALPVLALVGSAALWGILPFVVAAFWGTWAAVRLNGRRAARLHEDLTLAPERLTLAHVPARGPAQTWEANPHWVRLTLHEKGGPVPDYLTLRASGREVELGAFLSEDERRALYRDLGERLARLR
ncbi:MAG: DUF2244 domain-containing protein [Rubellimicrobium sp.]|nr:DUF2244 domain-containing protein [Rubellimicrobium sp.]